MPDSNQSQNNHDTNNARTLLRSLRTLMADEGDEHLRLERIVALIKMRMNAEICSLYLRRKGDMLELFATDGLRTDAVHQTTLRIGEGLVGDIAQHARPLNLVDASAHPLFVYRPETDENPYTSFVGVPLLRGGNVIGVLVVQSIARQSFSDENVEALQTVAMLISEMLVAHENNSPTTPAHEHSPRRFKGHGLTEGFAFGRVVLHEPRIEVSRIIADDVGDERSRLNRAIYELRRSVEKLIRTEDVSHAGEHLDVLETYRMFANDRGWLQRIHDAIETGLTAEAATERVMNGIRARLTRQRDNYLRERLHDFEDLSNRLLRILSGRALLASEDKIPRNAIIIARAMGPAELLDYDRNKINGVVLEEGALGAHVAIVARALNLPLVGNVREINNIARDGQDIIIDVEHGDVHLNPSNDIVAALRDRQRIRQQMRRRFARMRTLPALTRDGTAIGLDINAGLTIDVETLKPSGADNIGLFRTELQFMLAAHMPTFSEQRAFYKNILDMADKRKVTFRTVDIGGDKVLPYMRTRQEENPAMGWRALRMALDRPGLLRIQLRALLQAAINRPLYVMFPFVATIDEFLKARQMLTREITRQQQNQKTRPESIHIGAMLEIPALIWQLEQLLPHIDFLSIGTTDLMQFFFASDRGNPIVGDRYDLLSFPAIKMLKYVQNTCAHTQTPVSICGERIGDSLVAMTMLSIGYRQFSLPAPAIGRIKRMVRSVHLPRLTESVNAALTNHATPLRAQLRKIADEQGVRL